MKLPFHMGENEREELNVGTVAKFKMHNVGEVPMFKMHNIGTPMSHDFVSI